MARRARLTKLQARGFTHASQCFGGSEGSAASAAYIQKLFHVIMRVGVGNKCPHVKMAAARCLKAFANIGGPGFGTGELENCLSYCVKALEDPVKPVMDAFAEALEALLALGMCMRLCM